MNSFIGNETKTNIACLVTEKKKDTANSFQKTLHKHINNYIFFLVCGIFAIEVSGETDTIEIKQYN